MNIKERYHYKLTKEEWLKGFEQGAFHDFQWFFELGDNVYTLYKERNDFILHEYNPPCTIIHVTQNFNEMVEYIFSKGAPHFFES